jgi:hypothetical protein
MKLSLLVVTLLLGTCLAIQAQKKKYNLRGGEHEHELAFIKDRYLIKRDDLRERKRQTSRKSVSQNSI